MSLGYLGLLPPELIREICYNLSLSDIVNLQNSHPCLEVLIDNVFFVDLKQMEVNWETDDIVFTLFSPSTSTAFSTTTAYENWEDILYKSKRISKLSIKKNEDVKDFTVLDVIERAEYPLADVELLLRPNQPTTSDEDASTTSDTTPTAVLARRFFRNQVYRRLTSFMSICGCSLNRFRLETDPSNSIEYLRKGSNVHLIYAHDNDSLLQQQLIIPIFYAINASGAPPSTVTLRIGWREKPVIALQTAFHVALPRNHRSQLQVLKLDFGFNVSTLSHEEIQHILAQYAPYLYDTRRLQHLVLDLSYSTLHASELETLYSIISNELPGTHRISVYTSESLLKADFVAKQKHTNRVACS
uniref:F-box domain-containing protein n=3 Tax=Haemonchus contortus TaxID=6289 RepID=A0A7I4XZX3_HAECO